MKRYMLIAGHEQMKQTPVQIGELTFNGEQGSFAYYLSPVAVKVLKEQDIKISDLIILLGSIVEDASEIKSEKAFYDYMKYWINHFHFEPVQDYA